MCSCLHHSGLSLYAVCLSDPCKYLFSTNSWRLRSWTGEEWLLQSWRLSGKNPLLDVREEMALMAVSSVTEMQVPVVTLSVEMEEYINVVIFIYWWMSIALKYLCKFFPKQWIVIERFRVEGPWEVQPNPPAQGRVSLEGQAGLLRALALRTNPGGWSLPSLSGQAAPVLDSPGHRKAFPSMLLGPLLFWFMPVSHSHHSPLWKTWLSTENLPTSPCLPCLVFVKRLCQSTGVLQLSHFLTAWRTLILPFPSYLPDFRKVQSLSFLSKYLFFFFRFWNSDFEVFCVWVYFSVRCFWFVALALAVHTSCLSQPPREKNLSF